LNSIVYTGGWTDTAGAVNLMLNEFNAFGEAGNVTTGIVFTDGVPYAPAVRSMFAATQIKSKVTASA
jgi:hypothetical protein